MGHERKRKFDDREGGVCAKKQEETNFFFDKLDCQVKGPQTLKSW